MKKSTILFVGVLLLGAFTIQAQSSKTTLHLHKAKIDVSPNIDQYELNPQKDLISGAYVNLLTIENIPNQNRLNRLQELGIELNEYIPKYHVPPSRKT